MLYPRNSLQVQNPYRSRHAIFVRQGVAQAQLEIGEVPAVIKTRIISLRLFDDNDMMIDAAVHDGKNLADALCAAFDTTAVVYAHLHYATAGCFAAKATRV